MARSTLTTLGLLILLAPPAWAQTATGLFQRARTAALAGSGQDQAPAVYAPRIDPEARTRIENRMLDWKTYKKKAKAMLDDMVLNSPRGTAGHDRAVALRRESWAGAVKVEKQQQAFLDRMLVIEKDVDDSRFGKDFARRQKNVRWERREAFKRLFRVRMLSVYGGIIPNAIDELTQDGSGRPTGRYLLAEWAVQITDQQSSELNRHYGSRTGLSRQELGMDKILNDRT